MSKNISNDGIPGNLILEASVGPDLENTSENIIKVWGRCQCDRERIKTNLIILKWLFQQIGRADPGLDKEILLKGLNDSIVQAYLEFMVDVAVMFGANRTRAQAEMTEVLLFEETLVKVCQQKITPKK